MNDWHRQLLEGTLSEPLFLSSSKPQTLADSYVADWPKELNFFDDEPLLEKDSHEAYQYNFLNEEPKYSFGGDLRNQQHLNAKLFEKQEHECSKPDDSTNYKEKTATYYHSTASAISPMFNDMQASVEPEVDFTGNRLTDEIKSLTQTKQVECQNEDSKSEKPTSLASSKDLKSRKKSIRIDLVNKTVVRSIKRYYTQLFESLNPKFPTNATKDQAKLFEELTNTLTFNLFSSLIADFSPNGITLESIATVLRVFINPDLAKIVDKSRATRTLITSYADVVYKYSHKRLQKLSKNSTFIYLFLKFIREGTFESLIAEDGTMCQNPEAYLAAGHSLEKLFG